MSSLTRKIAEGTAVYTLGNIINNFLGFLAAFFLIKALGKFDYGLMILALSTFAIATIFLDIGSLALLPSEIARYRIEKPEITKSLIWEFALQQILFGLLISILLFSSSFFMKQRYGEIVFRMLWIVALMVVIKSIDNVFAVTFHGFTRFKLHQGREVTMSGVKSILAFIVLFREMGVLVALFIYPISRFISVALFSPYFLKIIKTLPPGYNTRGALLGIYRGHGRFVVANVPIKKLQAEAPVWIIQYFLAVEAVAVFAVARKVVQFLRGILTPISQVLYPVLSEISYKDKNKMHVVTIRAVKYVGFISMISYFSAFIFLPTIFKIVFPEYLEAIPLVKILLLILLATPFLLIFGPSLYAIRGQKYIFTSLLRVIPIYLVIFSIFTYFFGLLGSAISWVLAPLSIAILQYRYLLKLEPGFRISLKEIFIVDYYDKEVMRKVFDNIKKKIS
jgi:O-antigen/teichoic acid export membrane protein